MSDSYSDLNRIEKKIKILHTEKNLINSRVKSARKEVNLIRSTRKQKEIQVYLEIANQRLNKIEEDLKDQKLLWEKIYDRSILRHGMGLTRSPTKENEPKLPITTISDTIATNTGTTATVSSADRPIVSTGSSSVGLQQLGPYALAMQKRSNDGIATGGAIPKIPQKDIEKNLKRIDEEPETDGAENLYKNMKKYSEFVKEPNEYSNIFDQQNQNLPMKDSGTTLQKRPTELDLYKLSLSENKKPKIFSFDEALNSSPIHKNNSNTFSTAINDSIELRHLQISKQSSNLRDNPNIEDISRNKNQNPPREVRFEQDIENVRDFPQHSVSMEPMNIGQNDFNDTYTLNEPHILQNKNTNSENPRMIFLKRLNNIPEFDGETFDNLKKFVEKSETLFHSSVNDAERTELFEQILIKANGEARNVITSLDNPDWDSIKTALYSHYSHLCNKSLITTQLENLRQKKDESLTDYADRARKLLNTKNAMYTQINADQRHEHNRIAYKAFMKGLSNTSLRERVATRGAASLENAIENAIDMDTDSQNQIPKSELYCRICRINGHREQDCRRKQSGGNSILTLVNALRNLGTVNFNRNQNLPYNRNMSQNRPFSRSNTFRNNQYNNDNNSRLPMNNRNWNPNINRFNNPNNYNNYNNGNNPNVENNANTQTENQQRQFPNRNQQNRNNSRQNQVNTVATDSNKQRQQPSTSQEN